MALAALAALWAAAPGAAIAQDLQVLRIVVIVAAPGGAAIPAARHALLISDDPPSRAPRQVMTKADGTVDVRLRPGRYIVESDRPLVLNGKAYSWNQTVAVAAEGGARLDLTAANAEVADDVPLGLAGATEPTANDPSFLLSEWRDSVIAVWTPLARSSAFVVDAAGLVLTSQRAVGEAPTVEVQFSPTVKVQARVLASDRARDVAVLWVDRGATTSSRPLPASCAEATSPPLTNGQRLVAIGAPMRGGKEVAVGALVSLGPRANGVDFRFARGGLGGPVFSAAGQLSGLSSPVDDADAGRRSDARVVPMDDVCHVLGVAREAMPAATPPSPNLRPVEPLLAVPAEALDAAAKDGGHSPLPQMTSSDFDVVFLSPVAIRAAQQAARRSANGANPFLPTDFGAWADYFEDVPPVVAVRITPRQVEGFWMKVARGAALTQGAALPPIKRFRPGFSRLRVLCGGVEVLPIHPFTLELRVSETEAVREGLYVFPPEAIGPHCRSIELELYSEKEPDKPDKRPVDPKLVERVWAELAPVRAVSAPPVSAPPSVVR